MIPTDLKTGALVRCIRSVSSRRLREGQIYKVIGYNRDPGYSGEHMSVLLEGVSTTHRDGDKGWMRKRFVLVSDGDGADYQPEGDVDLVATMPTRAPACESLTKREDTP